MKPLGTPPQQAFTTGQVAKLCGVAPRTVSKWFDDGRLKGWRVPGSLDRRVALPVLVDFLKAHGMTYTLEALKVLLPPARVILIGFEDETARRIVAELASHGLEAVACATPFEAGCVVGAGPLHSLAVDHAVGRIDGMCLVKILADRCRTLLWISPDEACPEGFTARIRPDADAIVDRIAGLAVGARREAVPA